MSKLRPLYDNIVVKRKEQQNVTASGIILPDSAKEELQMGTVVEVGAGKINKEGNRIAMDVKVGDQVFFKKYGPDEVELGGDKFLVLSEKDVLCVVEG